MNCQIKRLLRLDASYTITFLLMIIFLAACSGNSEEGTVPELEPPDHLHDSAWLVTAYQNSNNDLVNTLDGSEISANFSAMIADGGTDSGFEGLTSVYYDAVSVVLAPK